ncbi:MAG: hypothetical protein AAF399_16295 [Bacteroidota bacterium]
MRSDLPLARSETGFVEDTYQPNVEPTNEKCRMTIGVADGKRIQNPFRALPFSLTRENNPLFGEKQARLQQESKACSNRCPIFFFSGFPSVDEDQLKLKPEKEKRANVKGKVLC